MFGERLKRARKRAGLSLRDLEERLSRQVSAQAIGKYERGDMMPGSAVLIALARALEGRAREFGAGVRHQLDDDLVVAVRDDRFRHRFGDRVAAGDRFELVLMLAARDGDEVVVVEHRALDEHVLGDAEFLVVRELLDQVRRRGGNVGELLGELTADGGVHVACDLAQDGAEMVALRGAVRRRRVEKHVGQLAQQFAALFARRFLREIDQALQM
ncbi:MAG: helix-turn-helix transcriptional regulator [Candidatus Competibacteraceae bacterium]|nr:helix-turn-helix transcriptional regulator [Candidatus Competibacteraceae bacterium]